MKLKAAVISIIFINKFLPITKTNYLRKIRQRYGPLIARNVFLYGKIKLKICKLKLHLTFLKTCKQENLLPTFVKFRIPDTYNRFQKCIRDCYRNILLKEIKIKKRELSYNFRLMNNVKSLINCDLPQTLMIHIEQVIDEYITELTNNVSETHRTKLDGLRFRDNHPVTTYNPPPPSIYSIRNLSKRILTNDENEALTNGLDFVCPSTEINEESFISNMELFFVNILGQVTDKSEYELIDTDEPVVYKVTPDQLIDASKLRSACEKFRSNIKKNKSACPQ
ncbi:unnamed protein product, partial [Rotaria sp. Silwood1]